MRSVRSNSPISLRGMLAIWALTIVVVATLAVGAVAVGAVAISGFRPAGTIRLGTAVDTTSPSVGGNAGHVQLLKVDFQVPAGQKADIVGMYTAGVSNNSTGQVVGLCMAEFKLDDSTGGASLPGGGIMLTKGVDAGSGFYTEVRTVQTIKNGIGAGSHTLYVIGSGGGTGCTFYGGILSVIANLHG